MSKIFDTIESTFNVLGIAVGISDIESWLGIALIIVNLIAILIRSGIKVYDHIKHNRINEACDEIDKAKDEINDLKGK